MTFLATLIDVYCWILILDVALSWFVRNPGHPLRIALGRLTDPVLAPIRRVVRVPGLDFSAMIVIVLLQALARSLVELR